MDTENKNEENHSQKKTIKHHIHKTKETLWEKRKTIFILAIIFLLGMTIRANLVQYEGNYLFEPDASYHARMILNLVRDGSVPSIDNLNYYHVEGGIGNQAPSVYWYLSALIYMLVGFAQPFNKELLLFTIQFAPAIFGALISIAMYFLGKEVFNDKKIGYVTAFLAAVTPAFVYRTMAGAQGDNSLGFLWMVIGFYFFVKSTKTKTLNKNDIINAVLAGVFFLIMAMTWRMYILIPTILIPYCAFAIIHIASTAHKSEDIKNNEVIHFIAKILLSLGLFSVLFLAGGWMFSQDPSFWLFSVAGYADSISGLGVELITILILIGAVIFSAIAYFVSNSSRETKKIFETLVVLGLLLGTFAMLGLFVVEPDLFYRGEGRLSIGSMVGEESVGSQFFGTKYNALIVFPWIAIIFFPLGLYFFKKEDSHSQILFFFWAIITMFMAWYKLKFTFVFGLGLVPAAAIVAYLIFETLKKTNMEKGLEAKITVSVLAFFLLLGIGGSAIFVPDYAPFPNQDTRQIELFDWINANTPQDAKFFNWWNEGHVLALVTERKFSTDNRNASGEANALYAEFAITTDTNRGYEIVSKDIGADYIYLQSDMIYSMGTFEYYVANKADSRLVQKYYKGSFDSMGCSPNQAGYTCGSNNIPTDAYNKIATTWKSTPDAFPDGANPAYYYQTSSELLILNQTINNTNFAKVWLNSEETKKYYEEVYSNRGIKVFKVLK